MGKAIFLNIKSESFRIRVTWGERRKKSLEHEEKEFDGKGVDKRN
jgi:hypothetical protein